MKAVFSFIKQFNLSGKPGMSGISLLPESNHNADAHFESAVDIIFSV
jgi:hypothetical protein